VSDSVVLVLEVEEVEGSGVLMLNVVEGRGWRKDSIEMVVCVAQVRKVGGESLCEFTVTPLEPPPECDHHGCTFRDHVHGRHGTIVVIDPINISSSNISNGFLHYYYYY
jgi:hypothetical protein